MARKHGQGSGDTADAGGYGARKSLQCHCFVVKKGLILGDDLVR